MSELESKSVSRRSWVKLAGGVAIGMAALVTGCAPEEKKTVTNTKPKPQSDTSVVTVSAEVVQYEKELGITISAEQRKEFPAAIKAMRDNSYSLRTFALSDGGSEPGILFTPTPDRR